MYYTLANNTAYNDGCGIYCKDSNPILTNVTIANNTANFGGGIYCFLNSNPVLENTIIWNNLPQEICFSSSNTANSITILYSDIMDGEAGIITNDNGVINWLEGNINQNPLFENSTNNDYHLTWENFPIDDNSKSPCINSGNPESPHNSDNTTVDMGAFYYNCNYYIDFSTEIRFGYASLNVNFLNSSSGSAENYFWDFENDGIYDSFEENPTIIYSQSGVYDVKLKMISDTFVDSLLKTNYIVIQENELLPPENLTINIVNSDVILNWTAIDVPSVLRDNLYYLIYKSSFPDSDFEFLDYTIEETTYTHTEIDNEMFYFVIGFVGTLESFNNYLMNNKKQINNKNKEKKCLENQLLQF